jgi:uncharacterized protein (DUF169 family)
MCRHPIGRMGGEAVAPQPWQGFLPTLLAKAPAAIVYAPFGETPVTPDVVLFACKPSRRMPMNEAANRAGVGSGAPALERPTCMALPASLQMRAILSLEYMGNRVYTGLGEDELYSFYAARILAPSRRPSTP